MVYGGVSDIELDYSKYDSSISDYSVPTHKFVKPFGLDMPAVRIIVNKGNTYKFSSE